MVRNGVPTSRRRPMTTLTAAARRTATSLLLLLLPILLAICSSTCASALAVRPARPPVAATAFALGHSRPPWSRQRPLLHSATTETASTYSAEQITVLSGLDPVRLRPGMYVGSTGPDGLHHLLWEVLDNAVDEALGGHATTIDVTLNPNGGCTVKDNGRGIPTDLHPTTGKSALETVLTVLHAGGKFENEGGYKVSGGLHGVGISVVNALSEYVVVKVTRGGKIYEMRFERGIPTEDGLVVTSGGNKGAGSGTEVTFKPDAAVFKTADGAPCTMFETKRLVTRMDEIAYLNAGLKLTLTDNREEEDGETQTFYHAGGLSEYMDLLCKTKTTLCPPGRTAAAAGAKKGKKKKTAKDGSPLHVIDTGPLANLIDERGTVLCNGVSNDIAVSVALRWSADQYDETILSFVNNIRTKDGGTHVEGLRAGITRTINRLKKSDDGGGGGSNLPGEYIREGLTAVISIQVPDPEFEGQTKGRLGNPEVRPAVDAVASAELGKVLDWMPALLDAIVSKAAAARAAALAARAARDVVRRKTLLTSTVLPGKLADCASRDPSQSEIFIVEGDSAAGSAKQGRDRSTQAILPLRGKILNIERAATAKIYQNAELQGLISALGLGVKGGDDFDITKQLRYHRIIVMTDADVDGAHIRVLLLTFFYRYRRELVEGGYVYIAQPPLYKIAVGGGARKDRYAYSDAEKEEILRELGVSPTDSGGGDAEEDAVVDQDLDGGDDYEESDDESSSGKKKSKAKSKKKPRRVSIQRFKGLGEMMPDQLWSTTMDPASRTLLQVTVQDCALADQTLSVLMGDAVGPRKEYISAHAEEFKIGDIDV